MLAWLLSIEPAQKPSLSESDSSDDDDEDKEEKGYSEVTDQPGATLHL